MTIKWTGFPAAVDLTDSDILVGLDGGTINGRFNGSSILLVAQNLSDVNDKTTAFDNLSPNTTKGDFTWFDGTNNARLPIGTANQILSVGASSTITWIENPALLRANNLSDLISVPSALTNLGLDSNSNVTFGTTTSTSFISTGTNVYSADNTLTAHSGGGQGSALALTKSINQVKTVAAPGDSIKLPAATLGQMIIVINADDTNATDCFPDTNDIIDDLLPNSAFSIASNKAVIFVCAVPGTWNSILSA